MSNGYKEACGKLIERAGLFLRRVWVPATSGNFSCRLDDGSIVITVSGKHKGMLGPDDFLLVDRQGKPLMSKKPSAETLLHAQIYDLYLPERFELVHPGSAWMHSMPRDAMTEKERARIDADRLFNAFELHRLHPDKVARTITGTRNRMHPTRTRLLSVRESSRLMAFPDNWKWALPGDVQQFAAGVCPPVAEWYGRVISHALAGTELPVPAGRIF